MQRDHAARGDVADDVAVADGVGVVAQVEHPARQRVDDGLGGVAGGHGRLLILRDAQVAGHGIAHPALIADAGPAAIAADHLNGGAHGHQADDIVLAAGAHGAAQIQRAVVLGGHLGGGAAADFAAHLGDQLMALGVAAVQLGQGFLPRHAVHAQAVDDLEFAHPGGGLGAVLAVLHQAVAQLVHLDLHQQHQVARAAAAQRAVGSLRQGHQA